MPVHEYQKRFQRIYQQSEIFLSVICVTLSPNQDAWQNKTWCHLHSSKLLRNWRYDRKYIKDCGPKNDLNVNSTHSGGTNALQITFNKRNQNSGVWSSLPPIWQSYASSKCNPFELFFTHGAYLTESWQSQGYQKHFFPTLAGNMLLEVTILIELFVTHAAFENTQWQKMSQIQSAWLYIWSANVLRVLSYSEQSIIKPAARTIRLSLCEGCVSPHPPHRGPPPPHWRPPPHTTHRGHPLCRGGGLCARCAETNFPRVSNLPTPPIHLIL